MHYRREIDGLRAVAVIPVILLHAGFDLVSGGFIGVDIFFVISGYLITSLLIGELEEGRFSIARFYERRARRILPALFLVVLCCIPFAWAWMLTSQFKEFGQSVVAVTFFSSNILFWLKTGYFAAAAEEKPLLHTWSLAVEEQFYIFFPLMLLFLWRFGRNRVWQAVVGLTILSLVLSEFAWRSFPGANFFLLPTRVWELGVGAICAFVLQHRPPLKSELLSLAGFGLILFSIFFFDSHTPFPSLYALAPVGGTALIIVFAAPSTWIGKLLSTRVFVGIGLISYSAYLWHQPLFAFARIRSLTHPDQTVMLGLAALSLALAYLSWKYVEMPFRTRGPEGIRLRHVVTSALTASSLLVVFGLAGHFGNGLPQRMNGLAALSQRITANWGLHADCAAGFNLSENCRTSGEPEFLLWGDSFAMHLAQAMVASEDGIRLQQLTKPVCSPVMGISLLNNEYGKNWASNCIAFNDDVIRWLENNRSVKYVVVSSVFGVLENDIVDRNGSIIATRDQEELVRRKLIDTVRAIRDLGREVVVVSRTPANGNNLGRCLVRAHLLGMPEGSCDFPVSDGIGLKAYKLMDDVSPDVAVLRLENFICDASRCHTVLNGTFLYMDEGHLSIEGSAYLGRQYGFANLIRTMAR